MRNDTKKSVDTGVRHEKPMPAPDGTPSQNGIEMPKIRQIAALEQTSAINVLETAFLTDPPTRYIWPDFQQYINIFGSFVDAFAGRAFKHGTACCVDDLSGVALWLPPGVSPDHVALDRVFVSSVTGPQRHEAAETFAQMRAYYPDEPHWHLALLGVDPLRQGEGLGSALLDYSLTRMGVDLAYLENSNPANIPLYERFGFQLQGRIQVGEYPPLFPMVRKLPG
jgi:ribosomal protein S18 acetylase RimI-like enzyme